MDTLTFLMADKSKKKNPPKSTPANAAAQLVIPELDEVTDISISFIKRLKGENLESQDLEKILGFCAERTSEEFKETKISKWLMTVRNWFGRS